MIRFTVFAGLLLTLGLAGCQQAPEPDVDFDPEAAELMLNCCLDITGSFEQQMLGSGSGQEGKAFKTFLAVKDRFFHDRQQSKDRFIITRIAGSKKALLLDTVPQSFQERFPDAEAFRKFILSTPDPGGSRVYDSLRDSIDYMIMQHRNAPKLKSMILIWSDMDDNRPDFGPEKSKQMLIESLRRYAQLGGSIGIYGCEIGTVPEWSRILQDAGFKRCIIEPDIRDNPKLPIFD
jgi:hypothetical protein